MKKILMIVLSLSLLVGCSNKAVDDTSNDISVGSNEEVRIRSNQFPDLYIPEADRSIDFDEDCTYFDSYFGEDSSMDGSDDTEGNAEIDLIAYDYDMDEAEYYLDGLIKYMNDIIGSDVSKDVKDKINSNLEECQLRYLTEGYISYDTKILENDIFTLNLQILVTKNPENGSMRSRYHLSLDNNYN